MSWPASFAIYLLFWVMAAFLVMPFHVRTADETGEALVPGQAESAPSDFKPGRILIWTTIVGTAMFAAYYANYVYGWITPDMLSFQA